MTLGNRNGQPDRTLSTEVDDLPPKVRRLVSAKVSLAQAESRCRATCKRSSGRLTTFHFGDGVEPPWVTSACESRLAPR